MTEATINTPAPAAAPVVTPAAAPAPTKGGGIFDSIKTPESSPADRQTPLETPPAPVATPGITPPVAEPKAGEPTPTVFKATISGREYTGEELVKAYESSSAEGRKIPVLKDSLNKANQQIGALELKIATMEEKLAATPPFKVLSDEELDALSPAKQTDYLIKKNAWETQVEGRKSKLAEMQEQQKAMAAEVKQQIYNRTEQMYNDPVNWPGYKEMLPVMEQLLDKLPQLSGMPDTPDFLYYAALGFQTSKERKASKSAEEKAKTEAAAKALADAAAAGGGNPQAPVGGTVTDDDSDEAFNKRILATQKPGIFGT